VSVLKAIVRSTASFAWFALAVQRFRVLPVSEWGAALPTLRDAWGNLGFSADLTHLRAALDYAQDSNGPILECGSGLTTPRLALLHGPAVWSLEHMAEWRRRIRGRLWLAGARGNVLHAPLKSYGSFEWYDVPAGLPSEFQLIVCDGPPGHTLGGRYGLLPIVGNRLRKGAVILLDDAERSEEQVALRRWAKEAGWEHTIKGDADNAYAVVTV
jgi:hypothetical protein